MAVRRSKSRAKLPVEFIGAPEPTPELGEDFATLEDAQLYSRVKVMLITDGRAQTVAFLRHTRGLTAGSAHGLCQKVDRYYRNLAKDWAPTSRDDQIFFVRHRLGAIMAAREAERAEFRKARRDGARYVPDPNCPSSGEERGWHELLARLEGNYAPTKIRVGSDEFDEQLLALLKVSSPSEVRALIEEGRRIVDTQGYEAAGGPR